MSRFKHILTVAISDLRLINLVIYPDQSDDHYPLSEVQLLFRQQWCQCKRFRFRQVYSIEIGAFKDKKTVSLNH